MRSNYTAQALILCCISIICLSCVASSSQATAISFDQNHAFGLLKKQCDFGPRPAGMKAHTLTRDFLIGELRKYTKSVQLQDFVHTQNNRKYPMTNIIACFGDQTKPSILLSAHWDTRPTADQENDPARRKLPIIGADDGASGVAILLELARMFHEQPPAVPVTIALWDGEDFGPGIEDMFLGARYFAGRIDGSQTYKYGILLDMVGQKNLRIPREWSSQHKAPTVVDKVWKAAADLGYTKVFVDQIGSNIIDDHIALNRAGVQCIDIIDFNYPYWHTLDDTPDKCSPESLKTVGETIARVVYTEQTD